MMYPCSVEWCTALTETPLTACTVHMHNPNLHPRELTRAEKKAQDKADAWQDRAFEGIWNRV